jgi:hypothetical protein
MDGQRGIDHGDLKKSFSKKKKEKENKKYIYIFIYIYLMGFGWNLVKRTRALLEKRLIWHSCLFSVSFSMGSDLVEARD